MRCVVTTVASFLAYISLKNDVASAFSTSPGVSRRARLAGVSNRDVVRRSTRLRAGGAPAAAPRVSLAALGLQEQLRKLCADKSEPDREIRIEEVAKELNSLNPTKKPAFSPLLAGRWRMLYSTVPGPSSGRLGPFTGDVFQDLRPNDKRIINILELGPSWALRGALEADVEVLDGNEWAIVFDKVYQKLAGVKVQEKKFDPGFERRIWNMTYLDEGFRVMYGRSEDMAVEGAFIFILERDRRQQQQQQQQ
ncbi:unnamed protein product [Pylaiella littoralis]